jgi:hypothetical protein
MKKKLNDISILLNRWGYKKQSLKVRNGRFGDVPYLTQYINQNCKLKTDQWDKILKILNSDTVESQYWD